MHQPFTAPIVIPFTEIFLKKWIHQQNRQNTQHCDPILIPVAGRLESLNPAALCHSAKQELDIHQHLIQQYLNGNSLSLLIKYRPVHPVIPIYQADHQEEGGQNWGRHGDHDPR